jgi:NAD(P)-dependent dehydrogenase (short-subunit alcohol dehydrogenase family)
MGDRLRDRVVLITGIGAVGPGWGNGKATAVLFAREGASVFGVDVNLPAAEETRRIIAGEGGRCEIARADVGRRGEVQAMVDGCLQAFGRIDVLVNNVGIVVPGGAVEQDEEVWDRVVTVNLKSMFLTCKHVLPHMERQGKGAIVNVAPSPPSAGRACPSSPTAAPRRGFSACPAPWRSNTLGSTFAATPSCRAS